MPDAFALLDDTRDRIAGLPANDTDPEVARILQDLCIVVRQLADNTLAQSVPSLP